MTGRLAAPVQLFYDFCIGTPSSTGWRLGHEVDPRPFVPWPSAGCCK